MRIALIVLLTLAVLVIAIGVWMAAPVPAPCCGNLARGVAHRVTPVISANASEVPIELQGCGVNREEITDIRLNGRFEGCVSLEDGARFVFPMLSVEFTTDGARCQGTPGLRRFRRVDLENVRYTASIRRGPPLCVAESSVTFDRFSSPDAAFANLFATAGAQTLVPVLDRFALGWLNSPLLVCPPDFRFLGVRSRCS